MSGKTPKDKSPEQSLALLLDALATELLAVPDHEVAVTLWELDATGRNALKAARLLVTSFNDSSESSRGVKCHFSRTARPCDARVLIRAVSELAMIHPEIIFAASAAAGSLAVLYVQQVAPFCSWPPVLAAPAT